MANGWLNFFNIAAGGLITGGFSILVIKIWFREQQFENAAVKFKEVVYGELKGLYPPDQNWNRGTFKKLPDTTPSILSAADEFSFFVESKDCFWMAVDAYKGCCIGITCDKVVYEQLLGIPIGADNPQSKEFFWEIVEHLLSFAERDTFSQLLTKRLWPAIRDWRQIKKKFCC